MIYLLIICLIIFLFIYLNKIEKFENINKNNSLILNKNNFNKFMLKNKNNIQKVRIIKNKEDINNCFKKCNFSDCVKLKFLKSNYEKCISCQKNNSNKCFNNLNSGGVCDNCGTNLKKFNCNDLNYYSCPNANDVYNKNGVKPYYFEIIDEKNISTPYKQSCLFCWNLKNYL